MATDRSYTYVQRALIAIGLTAVFVLIGLLSWRAANALLIVFAGLLVGVLFRGMTVWTSNRTGLGPSASLAIVCVVVALLTAGSVFFLAASITSQLSELYDQLPQSLEQLRTRLEANPLGQRLVSALGQGGNVSASPAQVMTAASVTVGLLGNAVVVLFIGLFLAADPGLYRRGLIRMVPKTRRARAAVVMDDTGEVLLRWLVGRLIEMTIIGILTWIGLLLMGVPLALALGLIAGTLSFIPNVGPVLSAIPAMLIASAGNPIMALYVGAFYLGLQAVESYVLEPYIVRKSADLPAALVVTFQLLMGTLMGLMGLTLATPLLAMITVLVERLYIEDVLGDTEDDGVVIAG